MKSFLEVIKEADDVQAKLKVIQDAKSPTKSIVGFLRNSDPVIKNAAEEELKRRRDSGDQEAGASIQPPKDPSMHSATTQVGGDPTQNETKTKEVEPNNIAPSKKGSKGREILNNLAKGKTITGDTPNAIELNPKYIIRADGIKEEKAPGKTVVFSFGRMNPPTIGHEKLVKAIEREASAVGGTPRLYLSRTEGDAKNPLPYAKKSKFAKLAFPIVKDTPSNMMPAGFIGLLKHLEDQFDDVVIVVGSDRLANIKKLAERYNGTEYKYNTIKVVSAGERDPDEEGAAGMSASKMRQAVKDGNMAAFKAGLPSRLKGVAKTIFDELSKSLEEQFDYELDEAVLTLSQRLKRRAMMRRIKGKIRMGQKRALARKASGKTITKRSKRIAIKIMRKRILRGRKYQDLSYSARAAIDRQVARRKGAISRIAKRVEPKLRQAEGRRKSGQGYKSISIGTPVAKKKLKEQMSRDNLIQVVTEMFSQIAEEVRIPLSGLEMATLRRKCNESNNSFETLRTVFDRGVASWYTGLREDSTPQQWGFARVNSFIANGRTRFTADRDLTEAKDPEQVKRELLQKIQSAEYPLRSLWNHTRNTDTEIAKAAQDAIEARANSGDKDAAAAQQELQKTKQTQSAQPPATAVVRTPQNSASLANALAGILPNNQPQQQDDEESKAFALHASGEITDDELHQQLAAGKAQRKEKEPKFLEEPFPEKLPAESVIEKYKSPETFKALTTTEHKLKAYDEISSAAAELSANLYALESSDPEDQQIVDALKKKYGKNTKQAKQALQEQLDKLNISHAALGELNPPLTDEQIKERRKKYEITDKRVVKEGTHIKLLSEGNDIVSTLLTGDIESDQDYSVAGNLASSFNEVSSGAGHSFAVENNLNLENLDDHMKMACHVFNSNLDKKGKIPKGSKLDLLGQKSKSSLPTDVSRKNINNFAARLKESCGKSVDQLNESQILSLYTTIEMAKAKTISTQRDMKKLGWDASDLQSTTLAGARIEKRHLINTLKEYKKNGGKYVVTGGEPPRHLDIDQAITYAQNGGGGENSSDTTILIHNNKTGEIYFRQTSDKSNPQDQTGNTTVNAKHEKMKSMLEAKRLAGVITEQQHQEAIARVEKAQSDLRETINKIVSSKSGFVGNLHTYLSNGGTTEAEATMQAFKQLGETGKDKNKYYNTVLAHYDKLASQGVPGFTANEKIDRAKFKKVMAHINDNPDPPKELMPSADLKKAIQNLGKEKYWKTKNRPDFGESEADKASTEAIFRSEEKLEESLNEVHPDMGSEFVEREQLERCHLLPSVSGALTSSGNPQSCDGFDIALGWCSPTAKDWRECTGLTTMEDLHKNVRVKKSKISATGGYGSRVVQVKNKDVLQDITSDKDPEELGVGVVVDKVRTRGDVKTWTSVQTLEKNVTDCLSKKYPQTDYSGGVKNESFLSFGDFLMESADKAVGNVPVISQKPIHHKASGHKYHMHHMINPDIALKHQVKHATQRYDRDVDSDIDQFDKPSAKFPDEMPVPTKDSTAKFFAKYKKEREHIHAGEPIDEKTITPKYTGDENSWYLDASGQKVQVYSQSDLKHPEDVGEFLKNPTQEKDIGPLMSMKDFLKTQPEKKK